MKKRALSVLLSVLALVLLVGALAVVTPEAAAADAHVPVSSLQYRVKKDNTVTITGCPSGARGTLEIPTTIDGLPVTEIGNKAFYKCVQITSVTIPSSVTQIGELAFSGCTGLTGVIVPDSVTVLGTRTSLAGVFEGCTGLISASIGKGVTKLGYDTFSGCTNLQTVKLPDGMTEIDTYAFKGCRNLTSITLPSSLKTIGKYSFASSGLTSIVLPSGMETIEYYAFSSCKDLKSVTLNNGLKKIGSSAFYGCSSLENIVIPDSVTILEGGAFWDCKALKTATVGGGVAKIDKNVFLECSALETMILREGVKSIAAPYSNSLPFRGCTNLKTIYLPSSLYEIGKDIFQDTPLTDVYFAGTAYAWGGMAIETGNDPLLNAAMHYVPFSDVKIGEYYYVPMSWAIDQGITNGTTDTTFAPGATCKQAQILTFLWRAADSPSVSGGSPYTNSKVEPSQYYYKALLWAYQQGVVTDIGIDPDAGCTRSDVVTYLWRLSGKPNVSGAAFTDVPASAPYAQAVAWAVDKGITNGISATTFAPDRVCKRSEIVTFLYRYFAEG